MPSLPSKTFIKYYPWNVENNISNYQSQNPMKQCYKITLQTALCVILTFSTICPFLDWFVAHHHNLYEHKYKMYFVYNIYFGLLPIPFSALLFIIVCRNIIRKNIIILIVTVISCILVSITCTLSYLNHENIYIGQMISKDSKCCNVINCNYFNPYWLSITLYPITILIIPWIICTCMTVIRIQTKSNNNDMINNQLINARMDKNYQFSDKHKILIMTCLGMLFVLWAMLFFCAFIPSQHLLQNYFVQVIYFWIVATSVAKFICKRVSRVIDNARCVQYDISAEIITEFYISSLYWVIFKYYTILYEDVTWKSFWFAKLLHIATEFYQSNIKMTKLYFNFTSKISNIIFFMRIPKIQVNELIYDRTCDANKWMIRISIDIMIRSMICVVINIFIAINIFSQYSTGILNKVYGKNYSKTYMSSAMERLCYSMIIEMVLYCGIYFYFRYEYAFNIYQPFINVYQACCKPVQYLLIIFAVMNIGQNTSQRNF